MSLASPTTARSSSASSSRRSPCRTTAWSSAITIVMWRARHPRLRIAQGGLGQVRLAGADDHVLVQPEVADDDHARADDRQRTVAAVPHAPVGAADVAAAKRPLVRKWPLAVPRSRPRTRWLTAAGRAAPGVHSRAVQVVAEHQVDQPAAGPALLDAEDSPEELAALELGRRRPRVDRREPDPAGCRIDDRPDRDHVGAPANRTNPRLAPGTRIRTLPLTGVRTTVFANFGTGAGAASFARAQAASPPSAQAGQGPDDRSSSLSHVGSLSGTVERVPAARQPCTNAGLSPHRGARKLPGAFRAARRRRGRGEMGPNREG